LKSSVSNDNLSLASHQNQIEGGFLGTKGLEIAESTR
jgi:hypothetical protein